MDKKWCLKNGRSKCRRERETEMQEGAWGRTRGRVCSGASGQVCRRSLWCCWFLCLFLCGLVWLGMLACWGVCVCLSVVAVLYGAVVVVGHGTGCAGTTAVRCQNVRGTSHSGRLDLCLHVSSIHTFCLQPPTLVMCSTASNAFTMVRGGDEDSYFVCMSVCRFDVLLSGGAVGQEMVFEEWKEQV